MIDSWVLTGAKIALGPEESERLDLEVRSGKIAAMGPAVRPQPGKPRLDLRGSIVLPGLINAHDHLEFNLFPRLGRGHYPNAGAWARDIYRPGEAPVRENLRVPLAARLGWGGIKNLLSGVTTVCHHNPYHPRIFSRGFTVRVPRRIGWAHSLEFSDDIPERFRDTPAAWPFVVHLGEAVDRDGRREILRLAALGALDHRTVLVHAVALGRRGLRLVRDMGAALVWCPSSNCFILGRTLDRTVLECGIPVALGTDSALSGRGDLLEELRFARKVAKVPASRLYEMVTREAARIMRLTEGEGTLSQGGCADLLVVRDSGRTPAATLMRLRAGEMELVLVRGEVKLASRGYARRLPSRALRVLQPLRLEGRTGREVFVAADLPRLFGQVEPVLGPVVLAHRRILRRS